jgi:hypothetical protein
MKQKRYLPIILLFIPLLIIVITIINSCKHDAEGIDELRTVCFEAEVLPIFQTNCAMSGCHDASSAAEGLDLSNYEGIMQGIQAGNPDKSSIYESITSKYEGLMPPDKPLSIEQRSLIRVWILQGAEKTCDTTTNPIDTTGNADKTVCFSRDILPILTSSCAMSGCHNASTAAEGYVFDNYSHTMTAVSAGRPNSSKLYDIIKENEMPPSPPYLTSAQKDSIYNWIKNGAKNTECAVLCDTTVFTFSGAVAPIINTNCKGCHNSSLQSGGINLDGYTNVVNAANSGKLVGTIKASGYPQMPPSPSSPLPDCKITQIEKWIADGKQDN